MTFDLGFGAHAPGDLVADCHLQPVEGAGLGLVLPRRVGRTGADLQRVGDLTGQGGQRQGQGDSQTRGVAPDPHGGFPSESVRSSDAGTMAAADDPVLTRTTSRSSRVACLKGKARLATTRRPGLDQTRGTRPQGRSRCRGTRPAPPARATRNRAMWRKGDGLARAPRQTAALRRPFETAPPSLWPDRAPAEQPPA